MKTIFPLLFIVLASVSGYAQCTSSPAISITGNNCVASVLTAISNVPGASIVWKKDGVTVFTQPALSTGAGVTVAGGNGAGNSTNQLYNPNRIYLDGAGNLYIPDMSNSRIQKWAPGASSGITVAGGNGTGSAANQFDRPTSVALDSRGDVYVTDQSNSRIQKWVPGAATGTTVVSLLSYPTAIFIDAQDNIYVSEQFTYRVSKITPAGIRTIVAGANGYGSAANQLAAPTGIYLDAAGNIYVCDTDNNRVQKWAPGATAGTTVAGGNGYGSAANQLANPLGVYVDAANNIYIADFNNFRVQKWAPGASSGITVAGGNGSGSGAGQFNQPCGVYMDQACNLYVADFFNHRVQKFISGFSNIYVVPAAGDYTASIVTAAGVLAVSNVITVTAPLTPAISIQVNGTTVCAGQSATFTATATNPGANPTYQWKKNGLNVGTNSSTYTAANIADNDVITCVLTSNAGCLLTAQATSNPISMSVREVSAPVNLGPDKKVCPGEQLVLDAGPGYTSYLWQDGSTNPVLTVSNPGTYVVKVLGFCGTLFSDTVAVAQYASPSGFLPAQLRLCADSTINLTAANDYQTYLWSTAASTKAIDINTAGLYWLQVRDENNCTGRDTVLVSKELCIKKLYVPNVFTPNNDGLNDLLQPVFYSDVKLLSFDIYNRWGQLVFHTTSSNKGWDGQLNGKSQEASAFIWVCRYQFQGEAVRMEKGAVMLVR